MKQRKLVKKLFEACLVQDDKKIYELRQKEFDKIFKHKADGKKFSPIWTMVKV